MELDIIIINASHFTSKKDNKVYNTINFIISDKENYIDTDNFKGYSIATAFVNENKLKDLVILKSCKGHFNENRKGLKSNLELESITIDGKIIDLL